MPELIVMLTHNDKTVKDAKEIFLSCKDLPVQLWGIKNIGLEFRQIKDLVYTMKAAKKTTFLEVVTLSEEECLAGAQMAVDCGFDYLLGAVLYQPIADYCRKMQVKWLPYCGKVYGRPAVLEGTSAEIADSALFLQEAGCYGTNVLAYRNEKEPESIIEAVIKKVSFPVVIAGNIASFARINNIQKLKPWAFTIGSALFDGKFCPDRSIRSQIKTVCAYMEQGSAF